MFKPLAIIIAFIILCLTAQAQTRPKFRFVESAYGLFTIGPVTNHGVPSPSATNTVVSINAEYIDKTSRIDIKPGAQFGVQYRLSGQPNDTAKVEVEWVFPEALIEPARQSRLTSLRKLVDLPCNTTIASTYSLNNTYEMMKGKWYFKLYYHGKQIYMRDFILR